MRFIVTLASACLAAFAGIAAPASRAATSLVTERMAGGTTTIFTATGNNGFDDPGPVTIDGFRVTGDPQVTYGNADYTLRSNGAWNGVSWIGTNDAYGSITFDLGASYGLAGAFLNYVPEIDTPMTISALDRAGTLIGTYDVATLAPISTPGALNGGGFRGIRSENGDIRFLTLSGRALVAGSLTTMAAVPEPGSWALMILGFGVIGGALRRQRVVIGRRPAAVRNALTR